jgi:hypothetical protein
MSVNYLSDSSECTLQEWQKQLIDKRLEDIANNPDRLRPVDELLTNCLV